MKPNIIFIESNNEFSVKEKKQLIDLSEKVFLNASKDLDINHPVNFTFYRFGKINGGFAQAKDWVAVTIPKREIDFIDLEPMLYHELHHIARGYCGYLENGNHYLLNSLFSEGLATAYELEYSDSKRKMTHDKYTPQLVKKWLPEMKKELYIKNYNYDAWFHGQGKPKQLGYKIGKYLVDQIKKYHPDFTHHDLARKDAKELLILSNVKFNRFISISKQKRGSL